jgi:SpoIID/LytB domain protein
VRRVRLAATACALALCALAPAARAGLVVHGRGFGHGIGMSQYGAYGFALEAHRSYRWILHHYYPGTRLSRSGSHVIRVRLRSARRETICGATRAVDAHGRHIHLRQSRFYTVSIAHGLLRFRDDLRDRTRATLHAPVRITGGRDVCLWERADNGVTDGSYRGAIVLSRQGRRVLAVNHLNVEHYLYGVVCSEMPGGWPFAALKAQAVASRTYALGARRHDAPYDVFASVRSQAYRGIRGETPRAVRAVHATSRRVVLYHRHLAQTYFFSTSGGRTAAIDEVWGVPAVPYLRSVSDPYDYLSPLHSWSVRFTQRSLRHRLRKLARGRFERARVTSRTPVGRVKTLEIVGTRGTSETDASSFRAALGLRSTWFKLSSRQAK